MPCDISIFLAIFLDELAEIVKTLTDIARYMTDFMKKPGDIVKNVAEDTKETTLNELLKIISDTVAGTIATLSEYVENEVKNLYQKYVGKYLDEYMAWIQLGLMGIDMIPIMIAYTVTIIQGLLNKEIEYLDRIIKDLNTIINALQNIKTPTKAHDEFIKRTAEMVIELLGSASSDIMDAKVLADSCETYEELLRKLESARRRLRASISLLDLKRFGYYVDSFEVVNGIKDPTGRFKETMKNFWENALKAHLKQELDIYKNFGAKIVNAVEDITVTFGRDYFPNHMKLIGQLRIYSMLRIIALYQIKYVDCKFEKVRLNLKQDDILMKAIEQLADVTDAPYKYCYIFPAVSAEVTAVLELLRDPRSEITQDLKAQIQKTNLEPYIYSDGYTRVTDQLRRLPVIAKAFKSIDRSVRDLTSIRRVVQYQLNWATSLALDSSRLASLSNEQLLQIEQLLSKLGVSPAQMQSFLASEGMNTTMQTIGYSMYAVNTLLDCLKVSPKALVDKVEQKLRPKIMQAKTFKDSPLNSMQATKKSLKDAYNDLKKALEDAKKWAKETFPDKAAGITQAAQAATPPDSFAKYAFPGE